MQKLYICVSRRSCQLAFRIVGSWSLDIFALLCQHTLTCLVPAVLPCFFACFSYGNFCCVCVCVCSLGAWLLGLSAYADWVGEVILVSLVFQLIPLFQGPHLTVRW